MQHHMQVRGDLGRRLAARRAELGLTQEETARRAGMATSYLRYLEESRAPTPGRGALLQLAGALETTLTTLTGGDSDLPPGLAGAGRRPQLVTLDAEECWSRLGTHGVGRLALVSAGGPTVLPVNYTVVDRTIAFRTAPGTVPAQVLGTRVAFEVDHLDEAFSRGWSVLVRGRAHGVSDPQALSRLRDAARSTPWAGGRREMWVCIDAVEISGRDIREGPPGPAPARGGD
ncbi:helix-turn-helix domain-containing protein [Streptomyces sp. bgisy032]|uniref:helix-turn-helix domain-containing protein n=1 Tax=Streptomyces sp. bgisy032 TaxID=3413773 RepID=UPI003D739448